MAAWSGVGDKDCLQSIYIYICAIYIYCFMYQTSEIAVDHRSWLFLSTGTFACWGVEVSGFPRGMGGWRGLLTRAMLCQD